MSSTTDAILSYAPAKGLGEDLALNRRRKVEIYPFDRRLAWPTTPSPSWAAKTPLQAADKPFLDSLCEKSLLGSVSNVPAQLPPGERHGDPLHLRLRPQPVLHRPQSAGGREACGFTVATRRDQLPLQVRSPCPTGRCPGRTQDPLPQRREHRRRELHRPRSPGCWRTP